MGNLLLSALDWSEVWALLIPLLVLLFHPKQPNHLKPVIIYLWLALLLNLIIDLLWVFKIYLPAWLRSNNPVYNIHSVARFICFSFFFIHYPKASFVKLKKLLAAASLLFLFINFLFFENFFNPQQLSGNLLAAEAYLLLIYCMGYYLTALRNDSADLLTGPDFWIVTGLSIYLVINFFVFLFYIPMLDVDQVLSVNMWNVHNIAFIIFCIFITKAFYVAARYKYPV